MSVGLAEIHNEPAKKPDHVIEHALGEYESVFILGYDKDGFLDPRSSTNLDAKAILFMIEQFKNNLLNGSYA